MISYYIFTFLVMIISYIGGIAFGSLLWNNHEGRDND